MAALCGERGKGTLFSGTKDEFNVYQPRSSNLHLLVKGISLMRWNETSGPRVRRVHCPLFPHDIRIQCSSLQFSSYLSK